MEVTGKIIVALPAVSGTSAAGKAWNKREYVLETEDTYPKKVFFDFFGEKADQYPLRAANTTAVGIPTSEAGKPTNWMGQPKPLQQKQQLHQFPRLKISPPARRTMTFRSKKCYFITNWNIFD